MAASGVLLLAVVVFNIIGSCTAGICPPVYTTGDCSNCLNGLAVIPSFSGYTAILDVTAPNCPIGCSIDLTFPMPWCATKVATGLCGNITEQGPTFTYRFYPNPGGIITITSTFLPNSQIALLPRLVTFITQLGQSVASTTVLPVCLGTPPKGCLLPHKVYDVNANGLPDPGEPFLSGYPVLVKNASNFVIGTFPAETSINLPPGTYTVCDTNPGTFNWFSTSNNAGAIHCKTVTVTLAPTCASVNLLCLCTGPNPDVVSDGMSPASFWMQPAGQSIISAADLTFLRARNLRGQTMAAFDPFAPADLIAFYNNALSTGPSYYYLSAQLAIADLLVLHGVNPNAQVLVAGNVAAALGSPSPFVTLNKLRTAANDLLLNAGSSGSGNQLSIALALVNPNRNQHFGKLTPCTYPTVASPPASGFSLVDFAPEYIEEANDKETARAAAPKSSSAFVIAVALVAAGVAVAAVAAVATVYARRRLNRPTVEQSSGDPDVNHEVLPARAESGRLATRE